MDISHAMKTGQGHAVYADGDHEATINLNGKDPDGNLTWNVTEHTVGSSHTTGVNLTPREAFTLLDEQGVQLDRGWIPDQKEVQMPQQPCPFCPIMGIDETEYRNVERTFAGEPANVNGIRSCEPCMRVIEISNSMAEYIADLAGRLDLPIMDNIEQMTKAIQEHLLRVEVLALEQLYQGNPTARCRSCGGDYVDENLVPVDDGSGEYRCKPCHAEYLVEQKAS